MVCLANWMHFIHPSLTLWRGPLPKGWVDDVFLSVLDEASILDRTSNLNKIFNLYNQKEKNARGARRLSPEFVSYGIFVDTFLFNTKKGVVSRVSPQFVSLLQNGGRFGGKI